MQQYICELSEKGSIVNTAVVMSVAERVVKNNNSVLLKQNGCHICFLRHLGKIYSVKKEICQKAI